MALAACDSGATLLRRRLEAAWGRHCVEGNSTELLRNGADSPRERSRARGPIAPLLEQLTRPLQREP